MAEQAPLPPPDGVAVWVQYSKERYDAADRRITDFRGWARQLGAAMGIVIGLEAALLGQLIRSAEVHPAAWLAAVVVLLASVAYQLVILGRTVKQGYVGEQLTGPESPTVLAEHVSDEPATRRMIGAYYAKASDESHKRAEKVAGEVAGLARRFVSSLWLLFVGMVLTAGILGVSSLARKTMADTPASNGTAPSTPTPAAPSPVAPASSLGPSASPLLVTPTPGQQETRGAQPALHKLTATPTAGLRITEGQRK